MQKIIPAFFVASVLAVTFMAGRVAGGLEMLEMETLFAQAKPESESVLSDMQKLKADNHKLKITVAQLQAQLNECSLNGERTVLTEEFMKTLGGKPGEFFDWNTLTIQKKEN
jgi:hypothetical protein